MAGKRTTDLLNQLGKVLIRFLSKTNKHQLALTYIRWNKLMLGYAVARGTTRELIQADVKGKMYAVEARMTAEQRQIHAQEVAEQEERIRTKGRVFLADGPDAGGFWMSYGMDGADNQDMYDFMNPWRATAKEIGGMDEFEAWTEDQDDDGVTAALADDEQAGNIDIDSGKGDDGAMVEELDEDAMFGVFDGVPQEAWELEGSEYDESLEAEVEEGSREWRDEERLTSLRRVAAQEQTRDDEAGREKERKQAEAWLRSQLGMGLEEEEGVGAHTHMQRKGGGVVTETAVADVGAGSGLRGEEDDEDDVMVGTGWGLEVAVSSDILFLVRKEEGDEADVMMEAMTEGKWDDDAEQWWGAVERDLDAKIQQQVEHTCKLDERVQYRRDADDEEEWNDRQWEKDRDELMFGADGSGRDDDA